MCLALLTSTWPYRYRCVVPMRTLSHSYVFTVLIYRIWPMSRHHWAWCTLSVWSTDSDTPTIVSQLQLDTAELYPVRYRGQTTEYMYRYYCLNRCTPLTPCDWPSPCVTGTNVTVPPHIMWPRSVQMMCSSHFGERGSSAMWSPPRQFSFLYPTILYCIVFINDASTLWNSLYFKRLIV